MTISAVDTQFRLGLQRVIARLKDKEAFRIVQADLGDPDPAIRAGAVRLIGELELQEFLPNIMERLQKLYGQQHPPAELQFTIAVFNALEKIGDQAVSEELSRRFEQLSDKLRSPALYVIASHSAGSSLIDGFFQGLLRVDTPYPSLRAQAIHLYGSMAAGHADPKSVVARIRKSMRDGDLVVAAAAAESMAKILGDRVFELPEWKDLAVDVKVAILQSAPAIPSFALEEALKSDSPAVLASAVQRVLAASAPPQAIRDVLRIYSTEISEELVVTDRLTHALGLWAADKQGRVVVIQAFSNLLRRHAGVLEKFLPTPGTMLGDLDRTLAKLRRAILRSGSEEISDLLTGALAGKIAAPAVLRAIAERCKEYPKEKDLRPVVEEVMSVADERVRKRIATEVRVVPPGAFIPIKRLLKIMPPVREAGLTSSLKLIRELAKAHADEDLEWMAVMHLAGCGEAAAQAAVCDAVRDGKSADVSVWIRALSADAASPRVRDTFLRVIERSTQPETFRTAAELLTSKADAEVSNVLMKRLPDLKGALRFVVIQAIGRMGDRVHLPVFLSELRAIEEDRKLAALLGLEKLLDANAELPPDTVSAPLYELKNHKSSMVRASAVGLLVRLKDPNSADLVSDLISSEGTLPLGAYRLAQDLAKEELPEEARLKLFQALASRIGRMREEEEAVCAAFKDILGERPFTSFLKPRRQRAEAVQDLRELLRVRPAAKASTDFKISKSIQRLAITFIDITGFTPRAAKMSAIELGVFLVQVEDEIMPFVKKNNGTLVKRLGDGFLVTFPGSAQAVSGCLEMLQYLAKKNQLLQEDDRIRLRAGIHVGDVLVDRDDVFGDTVNMAARIEALAKPMCICLTEDVYKELPSKNDAIEFLGPTRVKGKEEPVPVYRIRLDVIYEAQTEAIQKLMAAPNWLPKIKRFETRIEERYQRLKEKIEEARAAVDRGDHAHADALIEDIEKQML